MGVYVEPQRPKPYGAILGTVVQPPPTPKVPPVSFTPINRGDIFDALKWLRAEVYPGLVGHELDDEGIAAWICDNYIRYRQTVGHQDAKHRVFADIEAVIRNAQPRPPAPPVTGGALAGPLAVSGRDFITP